MLFFFLLQKEIVSKTTRGRNSLDEQIRKTNNEERDHYDREKTKENNLHEMTLIRRKKMFLEGRHSLFIFVSLKKIHLIFSFHLWLVVMKQTMVQLMNLIVMVKCVLSILVRRFVETFQHLMYLSP